MSYYQSLWIIFPESIGEDFAELIILSNDPNESDFRIPVFVNVLPAPIINISETALTVDVNSFEYDTSEVIISNNGDGYLHYDFDLISTTDHTEIINFTKEDYADWTLEENQDRISSTVWLTRQDNQGIFNAYYQESYDPNGPYGTSWRWGATEDDEWSDYEYTSWAAAVEQSGFNVNQALGPNQNAGTPVMSLYLEETDEYYDITFLSFTGGNNGGGMSYNRQSITNTSNNPNDLSWLHINIENDEVYFIKEDYADSSLAENQDRITDNVWITRGQ